MHIDTGIVKQERDGPVEFQHPYFRNGRDDLLENIKRKVGYGIGFTELTS